VGIQFGDHNAELSVDFPNNTFYVGGVKTADTNDILDPDRTSSATMYDSDGRLKYVNQNLAANPTSPATQTITLPASGAEYTVACEGSGSFALSGAGTGTASDGSPVAFTASSTSLTITLSGSLDRVWVYPSGLGGMMDNPNPISGADPKFRATTGYGRREGNYTFSEYSTTNEAPASALTALELADGSWSLSTGWTVSSGVLTHDGTGGGSQAVYDLGTGANLIRVVATVANRTAGDLLVRPTSGSTVDQITHSGNGTFTTYHRPTDGDLVFAASGAFDGDVTVTAELVGHLGDELVTNGDFSNGSTGWILNNGATVADGVGKVFANGDSVEQTGVLEEGETYLVTLDFPTITSGVAYLQMGGVATLIAATTAGTYTIAHKVTGGTKFEVNSLGGEFTCDNISVKKLSNAGVWEKPGLYFANDVTQLHYNSEDPTLSDVGVTSTKNQTDREGGTRAISIVPTATTGTHYAGFISSTAISYTSGKDYTTGFKIHPLGAQRYVSLFYGGSAFTSGQNAAILDLLTGAVHAEETNCTGHIEPLGNGYYACALTAPCTGTTTSSFFYVALSDDGTKLPSYTGDTDDGVIVQDLMIVEGNLPQMYYPTYGSQVDVDADPTTMILAANMPSGASSETISVYMAGRMTYADNGANPEFYFYYRKNGSTEQTSLDLRTGGGYTGSVLSAHMEGSNYRSTARSGYDPGVNVDFSVGAQWTATQHSVAVDGTLNTLTGAGGFPDVDTVDLSIGQGLNGYASFTMTHLAVANQAAITADNVKDATG
jgi:hypothetical protein